TGSSCSARCRISCSSARPAQELTPPPGKDGGHRVVPDRADQRAGHAGEPPHRPLLEDIGGDVDIGDRADAADYIKGGEAAPQPRAAQPLVAVGEEIVEE